MNLTLLALILDTSQDWAVHDILCYPIAVGIYVSIQKLDYGTLRLCEVEIYGTSCKYQTSHKTGTSVFFYIFVCHNLALD